MRPRREGAGGAGDRIGGVEHLRDPGRRGAGLPELEGGGGERGHGLERGQRGQRDNGQRHPAQAADRGGDAEQQDGPQGEAGHGRHEPRAQP